MIGGLVTRSSRLSKPIGRVHVVSTIAAAFVFVTATATLGSAGPKATKSDKKAANPATKAAAGSKVAAKTGAKPAAKPAPAKPSKQELHRRKRVQAQARPLLAKILKAKPGPERYKLVDAVIDLGDAAWPAVESALPKLTAATNTQDVVVDLLLGFMDFSYEALIKHEPTLSDAAARRVLKFVSRQIEHRDRFFRLLASMSKRSDCDLLPQVLGELVQARWPDIEARLIELIDSKCRNVQFYVVDQLATIKHKPAEPLLIRRLGVEQRAASAANLSFRIKLINAIAGIGGDTAVAPLIESLEYKDQKKYVLDGLRTVGMPSVKTAVFMLTTAQGDRVEVAFQILDHLKVLAAPELVRLLESGNRATRHVAIDVLTHLNVPSVRDEVLRMVKERRFVDPTDGIRLAVAMYNDKVRQMLFDLLEDPNPELRKTVVDIFWRLRDPKTFRVLRTVAAQDKDAAVRLRALRAVAGVGDPKGPKLLRRMLGVPYQDQRLAILEVLARVDTWQNAIPAVAKLLGDPNHNVFLAALGALRRMSFHSGPQRTAGWLAWHRATKNRALQDHELVKPRTRRFVVGDREMGYLEAGEGKTIVVVAGPPFRDATHLAPQIWRLADSYRVCVMQRAPGPYDAARVSGKDQDRELQAMLSRLSVRPVILMTDITGAHFALRYARQHKRDVSKVILHGAFWPTREALEQVIGQVSDQVRNEMRDDLTWGFTAQWRVPPAVRHRTVFRAALSGLLANWEKGRRVATNNLADDAFELRTLDRIRAEFRRYRIRKVRRRTLVLLGTSAPWYKTTKAAIGALKGKTKRYVRLREIKGAGWMPLLEKPDAAVDAIEAFID